MSIERVSVLKSFVTDLYPGLHPDGKLMVAIKEEVGVRCAMTNFATFTRAQHLTALHAAIATRYVDFDLRTKRPGKHPSWVATGNATALNQALATAVFDAALVSLALTPAP